MLNKVNKRLTGIKYLLRLNKRVEETLRTQLAPYIADKNTSRGLDVFI